MIQGHICANLGPFLAPASLVGIPKATVGIRPITVGLTLRRLTRKVALQLVQEEMASHLQPFLLWVGIPRGAEAIIHTVKHYVSHHASSEDRMVAQVDLSNAFNLVNRGAIMTAVQEVCPSIPAWVAYTLCCRSHIYFGPFRSHALRLSHPPLCP